MQKEVACENQPTERRQEVKVPKKNAKHNDDLRKVMVVAEVTV